MIDTSLFVASGRVPVAFEHTALVPLPPTEVFRLWTTSEGLSAVLGKRTDVELEIGGRFHVYFLEDAPEGSRGSEGCQLMAYVPDELLVLSWNAPPTQPESRAKRTWVVIHFTQEGEGTRIRLQHLGFGDGPHWDETRLYFQRAWAGFLDAFVKYAAP